MTTNPPTDDELIERVKDWPSITRLSHSEQLSIIEQLRDRLAGRVSVVPTPEAVRAILEAHYDTSIQDNWEFDIEGAIAALTGIQGGER